MIFVLATFKKINSVLFVFLFWSCLLIGQITESKLIDPWGAYGVEGECFGTSVSIYGNHAVVGAPYRGTDGAGFYFQEI